MRSLCILFLSVMPVLNANSSNDDIKWPDMPVLYITTVNGDTPKCTVVAAPEGCIGTTITNNDYVPGRMVMVLKGDTLYDSKEYIKDESGMRIKRRGNSTAVSLLQHPYKIKLTKKYDLLRRNNNDYKHKKWLLLSMRTWNPKLTNQESNILNIAGILTSKILKKEWTPDYEFVNLVLNGDYQGMYYLMESVDKGNTRINISDAGFLIESDPFWWNEDAYFKTDHQYYEVGYTYKYPDNDDVNDSIQNMIKNYMNEVEDCMYSQGNIADYIDMESFAKWILIHDILGTDDSAGCNKFLYKHDMNDDSKLHMGPVWDYDSMFRSDGLSTLHYSQQWFYYPILFQREDFIELYRNLWNQIKDTFAEDLQSGFNAAIEKYADTFDESMALHQTVYPYQGHQSFKSQMNEVMEKLIKRGQVVDTFVTEITTSIDIRNISSDASLISITDCSGHTFHPNSINKMQKGLYILKYNNGKVKKVCTNIRTSTTP